MVQFAIQPTMDIRPRPPPTSHSRENRTVIHLTTSTQMAITLNKYAVRCEQLAIAGGHITENSSARPLLYDISRNWRTLLEASGFGSDICGWSDREVAASEVIVAAVTYLQRIGGRNIDQLLKKTIERQAM